MAKELQPLMKGARRNILPPQALRDAVSYTLDRTYGPGYSFRVRSGIVDEPRGRSSASSSGRHIADAPGAMDIQIYDPQMRQLSGSALAPFGKNWVSNFGSIGVNARASDTSPYGWTHVDFTERPGAGTRVWNYGRLPGGLESEIESWAGKGQWVDGKPAGELGAALADAANTLRKTTTRNPPDPAKTYANFWGRDPYVRGDPPTSVASAQPDMGAIADVANLSGLDGGNIARPQPIPASSPQTAATAIADLIDAPAGPPVDALAYNMARAAPVAGQAQTETMVGGTQPPLPRLRPDRLAPPGESMVRPNDYIAGLLSGASPDAMNAGNYASRPLYQGDQITSAGDIPAPSIRPRTQQPGFPGSLDYITSGNVPNPNLNPQGQGGTPTVDIPTPRLRPVETQDQAPSLVADPQPRSAGALPAATPARMSDAEYQAMKDEVAALGAKYGTSAETPEQAADRMTREREQMFADMDARAGQGMPPVKSTNVFSPGQTGVAVRDVAQPMSQRFSDAFAPNDNTALEQALADRQMAGRFDDAFAPAPQLDLNQGSTFADILDGANKVLFSGAETGLSDIARMLRDSAAPVSPLTMDPSSIDLKGATGPVTRDGANFPLTFDPRPSPAAPDFTGAVLPQTTAVGSSGSTALTYNPADFGIDNSGAVLTNDGANYPLTYTKDQSRVPESNWFATQPYPAKPSLPDVLDTVEPIRFEYDRLEGAMGSDLRGGTGRLVGGKPPPYAEPPSITMDQFDARFGAPPAANATGTPPGWQEAAAPTLADAVAAAPAPTQLSTAPEVAPPPVPQTEMQAAPSGDAPLAQWDDPAGRKHSIFSFTPGSIMRTAFRDLASGVASPSQTGGNLYSSSGSAQYTGKGGEQKTGSYGTYNGNPAVQTAGGTTFVQSPWGGGYAQVL